MNCDDHHGTPQKVQSSSFRFISLEQQHCVSTPNKKCGSSTKRPLSSPISKMMNSNCTSAHPPFSMLPNNQMNTPPAKRFHRVRNPFEAALADRLHLPMIGSPSLFQRPPTPQLSSTQFEWTIDEVSSLKPANVEPHETQFHDSPDPELEAKAQSAINTFFRENKVVPSPLDCPLRKNRIILAELNGNTPITKTVRRKRDIGTQTALSLPFHLPAALEEALRPFLHDHLTEEDGEMMDINRSWTACTGATTSENISDSANANGCDVKDISLRRKLFDIHNVIVVSEDEVLCTDRIESVTELKVHALSSPKLHAAQATRSGLASGKEHGQALAQAATITEASGSTACSRHPIIGKLSDSMDKSSMGSLSPISAADGLSISSISSEGSCSKGIEKIKNFMQDFEEMEQLSPIHPPANAMIRKRSTLRTSLTDRSKSKYRSQVNISEIFSDISTIEERSARHQFSFERSSSPMHCLHTDIDLDAQTMADDNRFKDNSISVRVSRMVVSNGCNVEATDVVCKLAKNINESDPETNSLSILDDSAELLRGIDNSSSSSPDTPRSKPRSASRKNLSHSFSAVSVWSDDEYNFDVDGEVDADAADIPKMLELEPQLTSSNSSDCAITISACSTATSGAASISAATIASVSTSALASASASLSSSTLGTSKATKSDNSTRQTSTTFCRVDSGFNEMTSSSGLQQDDSGDAIANAKISANLHHLDAGGRMVCCSTPSPIDMG